MVGARDPRADLLDRSPFRGVTRVAHVHASDEPYRNPTMLSQFFAIGSSPQPVMHEGRLWHFSETEKRELGLALGAFTLALGLMSVRGLGGLMGAGTETGLYASGAEWLGTLVLAMPLMAIAIGPAFVLHELGHKFAARHYGCWAEFRSDPKGLRFGVLLAAVLGLVFMAPGAVMVAGLVTRRQNGHIAAAGPLVNLSLFALGFPLGILFFGLTGTDASYASLSYLEGGVIAWRAMAYDVVRYWMVANLGLGFLNMLPFGPLDGLKVKGWSDQAFYGIIGIFVLLIAAWMAGYWNPLGIVESGASALFG